jgi:hypothetical protein
MSKRAPRSAASKERDRLSKTRTNEQKRARAIEAAQALDLRHEALVPAIMRLPVLTSDGKTVLRGAMVEIVDGFPRRATGWHDDAIGRIKTTAEQHTAARLFQADHSEAGGGINVSATDYSALGGGSGDGTGRHEGLKKQIAARARLEGAHAHMGALGPVVIRVVLDCVPVAEVARQDGAAIEQTRGRLIAGLNRLVEFYRMAENANAQVADEFVVGPVARFERGKGPAKAPTRRWADWLARPS